MTPKKDKGFLWKLVKSASLAALGFGAAIIPMHLFLRRELRDAPEDVRHQGWPIQLAQVLFARYVLPWIHVEGIDNLPAGSYLVAANHGYKSGVDGFVLGHLLATRGDRVPRIVMTAEHRNWVVRMERWVLYHYGIALLVPGESKGRVPGRKGLSDIMAEYLRLNDQHAVLIFPAGRAEADPELQLTNWSTGVVVAARKSGCPVVPVAFSGLPADWTPETLMVTAIEAKANHPPFAIHIRIGKSVVATDQPKADLEILRNTIAGMMQSLPNSY